MKMETGKFFSIKREDLIKMLSAESTNEFVSRIGTMIANDRENSTLTQLNGVFEFSYVSMDIESKLKIAYSTETALAFVKYADVTGTGYSRSMVTVKCLSFEPY